MTGFTRLTAFIENESGVVSVDWIVLSSALVGLGLGVTNVVSNGMEDLAMEIRGQLQTDHITRSFHNSDDDMQVDADGGTWDIDTSTNN